MKEKLCHVVFTLACLTVLSALGVDVFYRALTLRWTGIPPSRSEEGARPEKRDRPRPPRKEYDRIVERNLFGSATAPAGDEKMAALPKEEIETLRPTSLQIVLLGTVSGAEGDARAVIEDSSRKSQGLYRVGDSIQNALIQRILRGKVVLRVGDQNEVLEMAAPDSVTEKPGPAGAAAPEETVTLMRGDIQQSLQNIGQLLTQARIKPHLKEGKPDGFVLSYIKPDSFFTQLGLQVGDIVRTINGKPIHTPEDAFSFYKSVESGEPLSMEIVRGGQPRMIQYEFK